eukprot:jgi/Mesvir1/18420/Mv14290-RA.1
MRTCAPKSPILALVLLGTVLFSFICVLEHTGSRVRSQSGATYAKSRLWNGLREIQTTSLGFRSNGSNPMYTSIAFIKTHRTGSSTLGGIFFRFANSKGLRVFSSPDHILRIPQHIVQGPMSTHFSLVLQHFSQRGRFGGDIRHVFAYFRHLLQDDGSIAFVTILREPVAHLLSYLRYYVAPDLVPPAHANTTTHQTTVPYGDHRVQPTITTNGHTAASGKSIQTRGRVELDGTLQLEGDAVVPVEHVAPSSWQGNGPLDALPLLGKGNLDKTGADFASPPPQSASAALEQLLASLVEDGSIAEVANPLAAEFGLYSEEDVRRFVAEFVFAGEGLPLPSPWFFFAVTEHFDESLVLLRWRLNWDLWDLAHVPLHDTHTPQGSVRYDGKPVNSQLPHDASQLSPAARRALYDLTRLDRTLYNAALRRLDAQMSLLGRDQGVGPGARLVGPRAPLPLRREVEALGKMRHVLEELCVTPRPPPHATGVAVTAVNNHVARPERTQEPNEESREWREQPRLKFKPESREEMRQDTRQGAAGGSAASRRHRKGGTGIRSRLSKSRYIKGDAPVKDGKARKEEGMEAGVDGFCSKYLCVEGHGAETRRAGCDFFEEHVDRSLRALDQRPFSTPTRRRI